MISLSPEKTVPLAAQLVVQFESHIRAQALPPGARLPSIRQLAARHQISRFVVIEAYERLIARGLVRSRHGSGFYVVDGSTEPAAADESLKLRVAEEESIQILQQFNPPGQALKLSSGFVPEAWRDVEGLAQATRLARRANARALTDYAPPHGTAELRQQLLLGSARLGIRADLSNMMVTTGASQALDLVVRSHLRPGDTVFVEDPGYYNLFGLLRLQGVRLLAVPRLKEGPDLETMNALLRRFKPKMFFVNTVFHNPTGTTMTPQTAFTVLQLAQQHGFVIVEDDVYGDLQATPTQRIATLDQLDHVIYIGGLSKTLSSSLRIGYVIADAERIKQMVGIKVLTSLGGSHLSEAVATIMLERGMYRKHLEHLRRRMQQALAATVHALVGAGWNIFGPPGGGSFVWARVPGIDDASSLVEEARRFDIALAPGALCRPDGEACAWIRINVAFAQDPKAMRFFERMGEIGRSGPVMSAR